MDGSYPGSVSFCFLRGKSAPLPPCCSSMQPEKRASRCDQSGIFPSFEIWAVFVPGCDWDFGSWSRKLDHFTALLGRDRAFLPSLAIQKGSSKLNFCSARTPLKGDLQAELPKSSWSIANPSLPGPSETTARVPTLDLFALLDPPWTQPPRATQAGLSQAQKRRCTQARDDKNLANGLPNIAATLVRNRGAYIVCQLAANITRWRATKTVEAQSVSATW